ncbi:MAG TPA: AAA family ATPase [Solirubrobacterales bacterium]|nr:AAA family ATPase [Solirubrobacterales bacterium]
MREESGAKGELLLEREREQREIRAALEGAVSGTGGALAIEGKAGVGKTRLLAEARREGEALGLEVLASRATDLEREFPFAVLRQLLDPQLGLLSGGAREALFEGAGAARSALGIDADDDRSPDTFSVLHAIYWVIAALAERGPLLLCVDDAHLADSASLEWLAFMLPRLEELPLLLALTFRTEETDRADLLRILGDTSVSRLAPASLSAGATDTLIAESLQRRLDPSFAATCHEVTGGNPFLVTELARELVERGIEPRAEDAQSVRDLAPERVSQLVLARLSRLPPEAAALARALAVLDDGGMALAAELAALDPEAGWRAADDLRRAAILDRDDAPRFVHPLVRNAIYADLPPGERARAHAAAAALLRKRGEPTERVASQILVSDLQASREAAETLLEVGRRALADGAPRSAIAYLTRALREPPPPELRPEVLGTLLSASIRAADHEALEAVEPEVRAAIERDPEAARRWAIPLTIGMVLGGRFLEAADILKNAVGVAVEEGDMETAFQLDAQLRTIGSILPSIPEVDLQQYTRGVEPDSPAGRLAAVVEARAAIVNGAATDAIAAARRALGNDCSIFEEQPEIASGGAAVLILNAADELEDAGAAADRALEIARRRDATPELVQALLIRGIVGFGRGDLVASESDLRQALELTRLANIAPLRLMCSGPLAEVLIERDELGQAEALLEETGVASGPIPANGLFALLLLVRGHLHFERGEFAAAAEDLAALSQQGNDLGFGPGPGVTGSPFATRALVATERVEDAREVAESSLFYARRWGTPGTVGHALRAAAVTNGRGEEVRLLGEAVTTLASSPQRLQHAHALVDLGAALRRANRRAEARKPLNEGLRLARRCGGIRLAKRAQQELQATGETVRRYAPVGVESLTPSERRVAEMAATGMTNRQIAQSLFVTLKTVEAHLSAAYDKLDIGSRRQLAAALSAADAPAD